MSTNKSLNVSFCRYIIFSVIVLLFADVFVFGEDAKTSEAAASQATGTSTKNSDPVKAGKPVVEPDTDAKKPTAAVKTKDDADSDASAGKNEKTAKDDSNVKVEVDDEEDDGETSLTGDQDTDESDSYTNNFAQTVDEKTNVNSNIDGPDDADLAIKIEDGKNDDDNEDDDDDDDDDAEDNNGKTVGGGQGQPVREIPVSSDSQPSGHFMTYFITAVVVIVALYMVYHNRQKLLAFIVEGRRSGATRRRVVASTSSTAEYRQLSNAEEGEASEGSSRSEQPKGYAY